MDSCPDKANPSDARNEFLQEFPGLLLPILVWETPLLYLPGHPAALRALGLIFIVGDVFFGVVHPGEQQLQPPMLLLQGKAISAGLQPWSPPPCVRGLWMCSEAPRNLHSLFIGLCFWL